MRFELISDNTDIYLYSPEDGTISVADISDIYANPSRPDLTDRLVVYASNTINVNTAGNAEIIIVIPTVW